MKNTRVTMKALTCKKCKGTGEEPETGGKRLCTECRGTGMKDRRNGEIVQK